MAGGRGIQLGHIAPLGEITQTSEFAISEVGPVGEKLAQQSSALRHVRQLPQLRQFDVVRKDSHDCGAMVQDDAPGSQRAPHAGPAAILEPRGEIVRPAGTDSHIHFCSAHVEPVRHPAVGLRLVFDIDDPRRTDSSFGVGRMQRGGEGVGIEHDPEPRNDGVAASQVSYAGWTHGCLSRRPRRAAPLRPRGRAPARPCRPSTGSVGGGRGA